MAPTFPNARRLSGALVALVGVGVLAGCAELPADRSLTFQLPGRYAGAAARPAAPATSRWWTRFRAAELDRLVGEADRGNLDIAAAFAQLERADAEARIAGAALFPQLGLDADASRARGSGTTTRGVIFTPTPRNLFGSALSASYVVDVWGRLRDQRRAAEASAEALAYQTEVVRLATRAGVVNAYLLHALSREQLRIAGENLANAERIARVIRERLAAGTGTALDLAQQESLVANQRASLPPLRQNAANALNALALLVGRPAPSLGIRGTGLKAFATPRAAPGIPAALLARRPDIRAAEAALEAAEANMEAARKALYPQIQLTGQTGFSSAALNTLLRPESALFSLAAGLTQVVFDGGRLGAQVEVSDAQRQERLELYRKAILSALVDVENALVAIRESESREAALRVAVSKAETAFRLAEERLRQGTIDLVILLNTQQTLFSVQNALADARFARLSASVALFQALGGDWVEGGGKR